MIRGVTLFCLLALVGLFALFGLGGREPRADFRYVNTSDIHTLDPARMSWMQDFRVALNIWEGLTTSDPRTTEPRAGAAYFPPAISDDGLTYTFTIREDARWSNGDLVTAADFIRGWRRAIEPGSAGDYAFMFTDYVEGAEEYASWRRGEVEVLTALWRARDGRGIDGGQVRVLRRNRGFRQTQRDLLQSDPQAPTAPLSHEGSNYIRLDSLHDAQLKVHAKEVEEQFAKVKVAALNDRTLEVRLRRPCSFFLDLTASPALLPCHASIERLRESHAGTPLTAQGLVVYDPQWTKPDYRANGYPGLITNGAFRLADWRFKRRARMVANGFHRMAATMPCKTVDMLVFDDMSAALTAYEAGDVDFIPGVEVSYDHEIARLGRSGARPDFVPCPVLATFFLNFNCGSDTVEGIPNPFRDARVRRAFTLATDRRSLVEDVMQRGDRVAGAFVPPGGMPGYESPSGLTFDGEQARALLAEAGFAGGSGMPRVELLHVATDQRLCQALAHMWQSNLGVQVELRVQESKTFAAERAEHRFMIARGNWYADYLDPGTFLDGLITGNGNNDSGYSCPEFDQLMAAAHAATDRAERLRLLHQAETLIIAQDAPILPILHYVQTLAIQPRVRGLYPNPRMRFSFSDLTFQP